MKRDFRTKKSFDTISSLLNSVWKANYKIQIWQIIGNKQAQLELDFVVVNGPKREVVLEYNLEDQSELTKISAPKVEVNFFVPEEMMLFRAKIKNIIPQEGKIKIEFPKDISMSERRIGPRFLVINQDPEIKVSFTLKKKATGGQVFTKNVYDLSMDGFSFIINKSENKLYQVGDLLVDASLQFEGKKLSMPIKVLSIMPVDPTPVNGLLYASIKIGARFNPTDKTNLPELEKLIKVLEQKERKIDEVCFFKRYNLIMKMNFISDVHIQEEDDSHAKILLKFLEASKAEDVKEVFLLGDIFDMLVGDYKQNSQRYRSIFASIRELMHKGKTVWFFEGNHDLHLTQFFKKEFSEYWDNKLFLVKNSIQLKRFHKVFYITHGDYLTDHEPGYKRYRRFASWRFIEFLFEKIIPYKLIDFAGRNYSKKSKKDQKIKFDQTKAQNGFRSGARRIYNEFKANYIIAGHSHIKEHWEIEPEHFYLNNGFAPKEQTYLQIDQNGAQFLRL